MDIQEIKKQLDYLEETKQLIKEQLVAKGQPVDENTTFREYVDNMNDLVDTTDANAETSDIATGKSGYVDGQKVDGNLRDIASGSASSFISANFTVEDKPQFNLLDFTLPFTVDLIHRQGSTEQLNVTYDKIATPINLSSDQIKAGETVLGINGKTSVVDTEDANAVAENIINGQTAYVNGEKVTGTLPTRLTWYVNNARHLSSSHLGESYGLNKLSYNSPVAMPKTNSGQIYVTIPRETLASSLGITADVVKTGTFISGVTGTFTSDANATPNDMVLDKTAYVNGQKVTGTLEVVDAISIDNSGNTDTNLMLMNVDDIPSIVVGADINDLYGVKEVVEDGVGLEIIAPQSQFASVIGLTADKIKAGETILEVVGTYEGLDTSDATAVTNDIVSGKTAYVNGQKLTGDLTTYASGEKFEQTISMTAAYDSVTNMLLLGSNPGQCAFKGGTIELSCSGNTIATSANITANKIAVGETVLGIVGTYMGTAMKEYASVTDMNNDIANISEGELVKVDDGTTVDYYIKDTGVMVKLVKESETLSPQEYEEANDIVDEILGEEE